MYSKFLLKQPTILFGDNAIMGLKAYPASRAVIFHGSSLNPEYKSKILKAISAFEINFIRKDWVGEPSLIALSESIAKVEAFKPDVIIAIGGGSIIDGVKMIRTYYEFPFFDLSETNFSMLKWRTTFIAIPTTIGSGAEISSSAVLFNKEKQTKEFVISHKFIPDIIILEYSLIINAPKDIMLSSMVDALSHCIEGYMSRIENLLIDSYAEKSIQLISRNFNLILESCSNQELNNLQLASVFAGIVQNHCIVGATHAIAHQIASLGISHSEAIAIFLPSVIRTNIKNEQSSQRFEKLAINSGFRDGAELLAFVEEIIAKCNLDKPKDLIRKNKKEILINDEFFQRALEDKGGQGNPLPMNKEFLQSIIKKAI